MGTAYDAQLTGPGDQDGIIPMAFHQLFNGVSQRQRAGEESDNSTQFFLSVQFLEIYLDEIQNLLAATS